MSDRLGLEPVHRVVLLGGLAGVYGLFHGVAKGAKLASFRYLAENAHRLPRTKGTWYFFHKRKNYVLLKHGMNTGALLALKYGGVTVAFFACEAALDTSLEKVSWISTAGSSAIIGTSVALFQRLGTRQMFRSVRNFVIFGILAGLVQDQVRGLSSVSRQQRAEKMQLQQQANDPEARQGASQDVGEGAQGKLQ